MKYHKLLPLRSKLQIYERIPFVTIQEGSEIHA